MATTQPSSRPTRPGLFDQLDTDWANTHTTVTATERFGSWQASDHRFACCATLGDVVGRIRTGPIEESRQVCWALLDLVAAGDELASRVLLQAMIPGLVGEMARWLIDVSHSPTARNAFDGPAEAEQMLVTEAAQAIADHAGRQPNWPIADLLRRTHRLVLRRVRTERAWASRTVALTEPATTTTTDTGDEHDGDIAASTAERLAGELATRVRHGQITPVEGQIVWLTRSAGYRPDDIAADFGLSPDTFRRRRHRIEARLTDTTDLVA